MKHVYILPAFLLIHHTLVSLSCDISAFDAHYYPLTAIKSQLIEDATKVLSENPSDSVTITHLKKIAVDIDEPCMQAMRLLARNALVMSDYHDALYWASMGARCQSAANGLGDPLSKLCVASLLYNNLPVTTFDTKKITIEELLQDSTECFRLGNSENPHYFYLPIAQDYLHLLLQQKHENLLAQNKKNPITIPLVSPMDNTVAAYRIQTLFTQNFSPKNISKIVKTATGLMHSPYFNADYFRANGCCQILESLLNMSETNMQEKRDVLKIVATVGYSELLKKKLHYRQQTLDHLRHPVCMQSSSLCIMREVIDNNMMSQEPLGHITGAACFLDALNRYVAFHEQNKTFCQEPVRAVLYSAAREIVVPEICDADLLYATALSFLKIPISKKIKKNKKSSKKLQAQSLSLLQKAHAQGHCYAGMQCIVNFPETLSTDLIEEILMRWPGLYGQYPITALMSALHAQSDSSCGAAALGMIYLRGFENVLSPNIKKGLEFLVHAGPYGHAAIKAHLESSADPQSRWYALCALYDYYEKINAEHELSDMAHQFEQVAQALYKNAPKQVIVDCLNRKELYSLVPCHARLYLMSVAEKAQEFDDSFFITMLQDCIKHSEQGIWDAYELINFLQAQMPFLLENEKMQQVRCEVGIAVQSLARDGNKKALLAYKHNFNAPPAHAVSYLDAAHYWYDMIKVAEKTADETLVQEILKSVSSLFDDKKVSFDSPDFYYLTSLIFVNHAPEKALAAYDAAQKIEFYKFSTGMDEKRFEALEGIEFLEEAGHNGNGFAWFLLARHAFARYNYDRPTLSMEQRLSQLKYIKRLLRAACTSKKSYEAHKYLGEIDYKIALLYKENQTNSNRAAYAQKMLKYYKRAIENNCVAAMDECAHEYLGSHSWPHSPEFFEKVIHYICTASDTSERARRTFHQIFLRGYAYSTDWGDLMTQPLKQHMEQTLKKLIDTGKSQEITVDMLNFKTPLSQAVYLLEYQKNHNAAYTLFKTVAESGNAFATAYIGVMHANNLLPESNPQLARHWCTQALQMWDGRLDNDQEEWLSILQVAYNYLAHDQHRAASHARIKFLIQGNHFGPLLMRQSRPVRVFHILEEIKKCAAQKNAFGQCAIANLFADVKLVKQLLLPLAKEKNVLALCEIADIFLQQLLALPECATPLQKDILVMPFHEIITLYKKELNLGQKSREKLCEKLPASLVFGIEKNAALLQPQVPAIDHALALMHIKAVPEKCSWGSFARALELLEKAALHSDEAALELSELYFVPKSLGSLLKNQESKGIALCLALIEKNHLNALITLDCWYRMNYADKKRVREEKINELTFKLESKMNKSAVLEPVASLNKAVHHLFTRDIVPYDAKKLYELFEQIALTKKYWPARLYQFYLACSDEQLCSEKRGALMSPAQLLHSLESFLYNFDQEDEAEGDLAVVIIRNSGLADLLGNWCPRMAKRTGDRSVEAKGFALAAWLYFFAQAPTSASLLENDELQNANSLRSREYLKRALDADSSCFSANFLSLLNFVHHGGPFERDDLALIKKHLVYLCKGMGDERKIVAQYPLLTQCLDELNELFVKQNTPEAQQNSLFIKKMKEKYQ